MNKGFQISVAPMMDWTDRHCRYFHRLISPNALLYTEMVTTGALIHGDVERHLRFNAEEHPVALQLGGSNPEDLATCAKMGEDYGYDEINLNCGCPSDRVQKGRFGACLMAEPDLVAECVSAMAAAVSIPVTVKCRIAIDEYEELPFLNTFIQTVSETGCDTFIIHARKAWLQGLSPKENREVPPLRHDIVERIKSDYPELKIILNGGIGSIEDIQNMDSALDGAMVGRRAYQDPYFLAEVEKHVFENATPLTREAIVEAMISYIEREIKDHGTPMKSITRHMIGLFQDIPGAKRWRRILSENAHKPESTPDLIRTALDNVLQPA